MKEMFFNCSSLIKIPDISIWKSEKLKDINNMFDSCDNLIGIPDIFKWNIDKVNAIKMNFSFTNVISSSQLNSKGKDSFISSSKNSERNASNTESLINKEYVDYNLKLVFMIPMSMMNIMNIFISKELNKFQKLYLNKLLIILRSDRNN